MGPHTETLGLVAPGDWVDFFRYIGETYNGVVVPENDDRDLRALLIPKVMAAKDRFDVNFVRDYQPPQVGDWLESENELGKPLEPYFLRANTGPRWILGGVISRPFINASQCSEKFAISSIESSSVYEKSPLERWITFESVDHCFFVTEGLLRVKVKGNGNEEWNTVREGQTLVVAAGQPFALAFGSRYVKAILFTNGRGLEELIQTAGTSFSSFVLPEEAQPWVVSSLQAPSQKIGAKIEEDAA